MSALSNQSMSGLFDTLRVPLTSRTAATDDAKRQRAAKTSDLQVFDWPTPHITVSYRQTTYALGRQEVAELGYSTFKREFFRTMVWDPLSSFSGSATNLEVSEFERAAVLLGVFRTVHGEHDTRPVRLASIGWESMVEDLISIEVVYDAGLPELQQLTGGSEE